MAPLVHRITEGERFDEVRALFDTPDKARAALARRVGQPTHERVFLALHELGRACGSISAAHVTIRRYWEARLIRYVEHAFPHAAQAAREALGIYNAP